MLQLIEKIEKNLTEKKFEISEPITTDHEQSFVGALAKNESIEVLLLRNLDTFTIDLISKAIKSNRKITAISFEYFDPSPIIDALPSKISLIELKNISVQQMESIMKTLPTNQSVIALNICDMDPRSAEVLISNLQECKKINRITLKTNSENILKQFTAFLSSVSAQYTVVFNENILDENIKTIIQILASNPKISFTHISPAKRSFVTELVSTYRKNPGIDLKQLKRKTPEKEKNTEGTAKQAIIIDQETSSSKEKSLNKDKEEVIKTNHKKRKKKTPQERIEELEQKVTVLEKEKEDILLQNVIINTIQERTANHYMERAKFHKQEGYKLQDCISKLMSSLQSSSFTQDARSESTRRMPESKSIENPASNLTKPPQTISPKALFSETPVPQEAQKTSDSIQKSQKQPILTELKPISPPTKATPIPPKTQPPVMLLSPNGPIPGRPLPPTRLTMGTPQEQTVLAKTTMMPTQSPPYTVMHQAGYPGFFPSQAVVSKTRVGAITNMATTPTQQLIPNAGRPGKVPPGTQVLSPTRTNLTTYTTTTLTMTPSKANSTPSPMPYPPMTARIFPAQPSPQTLAGIVPAPSVPVKSTVQVGNQPNTIKISLGSKPNPPTSNKEPETPVNDRDQQNSPTQTITTTTTSTEENLGWTQEDFDNLNNLQNSM